MDLAFTGALSESESRDKSRSHVHFMVMVVIFELPGGARPLSSRCMTHQLWIHASPGTWFHNHDNSKLSLASSREDNKSFKIALLQLLPTCVVILLMKEGQLPCRSRWRSLLCSSWIFSAIWKLSNAFQGYARFCIFQIFLVFVPGKMKQNRRNAKEWR